MQSVYKGHRHGLCRRRLCQKEGMTTETLWTIQLFVRVARFVEGPRRDKVLCFSRCEQQRGSFWHSEGLLMRAAPWALESPESLLTKHARHRKVFLPGHPQTAWYEARVSTHNSETEVIRSGLHKGTLFWVVQSITNSSQALGFNELVNSKRRLQWPT